MKFKKALSTLILFAILATTFTVTPVFSQDLQRGPKIDKLRSKVIEGIDGGGYSHVPVAELYVDGFNEAFTQWTTVGVTPYLDAADFPANYIQGTEYSSLIGSFTFEDTTLAADEFESATIEAYATSEDPGIDGDIYLFAGPHSWVWAGSIEARSQWSWTVLDLPSYLLDPALINDMEIVIHYWTPDEVSRGAMKVDAVRLVLSRKGEWVPSPPVLALQNSEVDVVTDMVRPEDIEKLDEECNTITSTPGFHLCYIGFNIRPDQSYRRPDVAYWPLADVGFRHALIHGYDQLTIIDAIYGFTVTPVQSLVPPAQGEWYNPSVPLHPFNPGDPFTSPPSEHSTVGILKAAGYTFVDADNSLTVTDPDYWLMPDGEPLPRMAIWTPPVEVAPTSYWHVAEFIADLATVGLKATTENGENGLINEGADFSWYYEKVFWEADFDGYMLCFGLGMFPTHLYDMTHSSQDSHLYPGGGNAPGIMSPELDALTEIVRFSLDHNAKLAAAHEVQSRLYNPNYASYALAYMNLYSRKLFNAFKTGLGGIIDSPGYGSDNMWTFLNMHWQPGHPNARIEDGKNTVIWCLNDEPERLNPLYAYTTYAWEILDRIYDPLTAINPYNHEDESWLATEWHVMETPAGPGAMEITFWLRDDIHWQDGEPYTAEDAKFNWLFLRDNQIPRYKSLWEHIVDVEIIDTYTVKVYLDVTSQWFFYDLVATAALLPPPIWSAWDGRPLAEILGRDPSTEPGWNGVTPTNLFGTGPFVFQFYDPVAIYTEMLANRYYFKTTEEIQSQIVEMFWTCGDVNRDGIVDQTDKDRYEAAYDSRPGDPNWDPDCDLNSDCLVDIRDGAKIAYFFGKTREVRKAICYISVAVDIKPGSWPNPINVRSNGVFAVAICGTEDFDVMTIDPAAVKLYAEGIEEGVPPVCWEYEDAATPYLGPLGGGHELQGDGFIDLVLHFNKQEVVNTLILPSNEIHVMTLIIKGNLYEELGGTPIQGQDYIRVIGLEESAGYGHAHR